MTTVASKDTEIRLLNEALFAKEAVVNVLQETLAKCSVKTAMLLNEPINQTTIDELRSAVKLSNLYSDATHNLILTNIFKFVVWAQSTPGTDLQEKAVRYVNALSNQNMQIMPVYVPVNSVDSNPSIKSE